MQSRRFPCHIPLSVKTCYLSRIHTGCLCTLLHYWEKQPIRILPVRLQDCHLPESQEKNMNLHVTCNWCFYFSYWGDKGNHWTSNLVFAFAYRTAKQFVRVNGSNKRKLLLQKEAKENWKTTPTNCGHALLFFLGHGGRTHAQGTNQISHQLEPFVHDESFLVLNFQNSMKAQPNICFHNANFL